MRNLVQVLLPAVAACGAVDGADGAVISTDRPSFSDGTGLVPAGHLQVEAGGTFTRRADGGVDSTRHAGPEVLVRHRVLEGLEARVGWGGYLTQRTEDGVGGTVDGASDLTLGVKVPLADQHGLLPTLAFGANVTLGSGDDPFTTGSHALPVGKLLWSYALPAGLGLGGNLNLGFPAQSGERYTQAAASACGIWSPRGGTTLFLEYFLIAPFADGTAVAHNLDAGVLQLLSARTQIDARVGCGLGGPADELVAGVGISILF